MGNNDSNNNNGGNIENVKQNEISTEQRQLIYKGEYSEIFKYKNSNNENIALKIINKNNISQILNNINQTDLNQYILEKISLMKEINSKTEYSIKIYSEFIKDENYFIEMEFCDYNLRQYFEKYYKEKGMDISDIKDLFKKLNNVFVIMEEKKVFHGDIKPDHILINEKEEKNISPRFIDYLRFNSFSKKFDLYNAPEIIDNFINNENNEISIKADLWSIGLILYELYFKSLPFNGKDELIDIIKKKKNLNLLKSENNDDFNDLIEKLLNININDRISLKDYINHTFWNNNQSPNTKEQLLSSKNIINNNEHEEDKQEDKNDKNNFYNNIHKEFIFEFKTENYEKELNDFSRKDLQNFEIFKFSGFNSKKTYLDDKKIMQFIKNLKLKNLKKLYLDKNDIINIKGLNDFIFDDLTHLYLNSNKINDIKELTQVKFEKLLLLDLSQNEIINIESLSKTNIENLIILNLSDNKINDISCIKHFHFNNLKILNLSFNQINNIDILSQVSFINLKSLYLNNNQIKNIEVFCSIPFEKLEILSLSNNDIINIKPLRNSKLKSLQKLDLSFNKIDNIEILKSSMFDKLEFLNISFNKLDNIDALEESKLKSIKKICFYGNDLINLDSLYVKEIINKLKNKHINII